MKHIKTFESFSSKLDEGMWSKFKTSILGTVPDVEELVKELPEKIEKYKEAYEDFKLELEGYKKRVPSAYSEIKDIKVPGSDQIFPYSDENYLALAGYYNFNVNLIPNISRKNKKAMPTIGIQEYSGSGSGTGHSSGPNIDKVRNYQKYA